MTQLPPTVLNRGAPRSGIEESVGYIETAAAVSRYAGVVEWQTRYLEGVVSYARMGSSPITRTKKNG